MRFVILPFWVSICMLFLSHPKAIGQVWANCDDLQLKNGVFSPAWRASYERWTENNSLCTIVYDDIEEGFLPDRHQIKKPSDGYVPNCYAGSSQIPFVPPGYKHSIQLGDFDDGRRWERLETMFEVNDDNALIEINLSVFLEDKNHNQCRQPRFWVRLFDANGALAPCGDYQVIAAGNLPGWRTTDLCVGLEPIRYLPWTKMSIDLRKYLGQRVTLQFQTMDCSEGGHFGFALFAIKCLDAKIAATPFCPNSTSITLTAPEGYSRYVWSNGATGRVITVNAPQAGKSYKVTLYPYSNLNGNCQVELEYVVPTPPTLSLPPEISFCTGGSISVQAEGLPNTYQYKWSNGLAMQNIQITTPGRYDVTATDGNCTQIASVWAKEVPLPQFNTETVPAPCHGALGQARVVPVNPSANYTYAWPNGERLPAVSLRAGVYTITVSEGNCRDTATLEVLQPDSIVLQTKLDVLSNGYPLLCPFDSNAIARITAQNGNAPYTYLWSNGAKGAVANLKAGSYVVRVTDAKGCTKDTSVEVKQPERLAVKLEAVAPQCFGIHDGYVAFEKISGQGDVWLELNGQKATLAPGRIRDLSPGTYRLHASDEYCDWDTAIVFPALPKQVVDLRDSIVEIALGDSYDFRTTTNAKIKSIKYEPNDFLNDPATLRPNASPKKTIRYTVTVTTEDGCVLTDNLLIKVTNNREVYVPNVFAPDRPGENATFHVSAKPGITREMNLRVFDRSGGLVYKKEHFNPDTSTYNWDGLWRGKLAPPGVYVWHLNIIYTDDTFEDRKGDVTLLR